MSDTPQEPLPPTVPPVVWTWSALAAVALVVATAVAPPAWPPGPDASWSTLLLVAAGAAILGRVTVNIAVGGVLQTTSIDEAVVILAVGLLDPLWGLAALFLGQLVIQLTTFHRTALKFVFNVAWSIVATLAAYGAFALVAGSEPSVLQRDLGLLAAAVTYPLVNLVALTHIRSAHDRLPFSEVARGELGGAYPTSVAIGGVGIVGLRLLDTAPELLPLLLLPAVLGHTRAARTREAQQHTAEERDKLMRTIEGTSDGIALLDGYGHVEVCNRAFGEILDVRPDRLVGQRLEDHIALTNAQGLPLRFEDPTATPDAPHRTVDADNHVSDPPRVVAVDSTTLFDAETMPSGQVVIIRDVTRQREVDNLHADLVSRVSHELRTPLTTIAGFTETLLNRWTEFDEEQRLRCVEVVDRGTRRLSRLVMALQAQAGVQHAGLSPHPSAVDVAASVSDAIVDLAHEIDVPVQVTSMGPVAATVDEVHLRQIVDNLLVNAATYGAPPIEVRLTRQHDHVRIAVRDHGPGVPDDFLPRLFEPFSQASMGDRRTARGLGLGLSIVRSLVDANGGRITYRAAEGGGALFTVDLPVASGSGVRGAPDRSRTG